MECCKNIGFSQLQADFTIFNTEITAQREAINTPPGQLFSRYEPFRLP